MGSRQPRRRAWKRTAAAAAVLVATAILGIAPAASAAPGDDRSAQAQAMLDRILGPGHAIVQISATVQSGSGSTTSESWGAALPQRVAATRLRTASGTSTSVAQVDAVDRTTVTTRTPPGTLLRQTVSVALDRTVLPRAGVGHLRHLIAAAVGLSPGRGDRLFVLRTTFAKPATPSATTSPSGGATAFAVPALEAGGAVVAMLIVVLAFRRGRRAPVLDVPPR